jgi:hypothetical protein
MIPEPIRTPVTPTGRSPRPNRPPAAAGALLALVLIGGFVVPRAWSALPDNFTDELVASGLSQPNSMAFLPDGRALVTEQNTREIELVVGGSLSTVHTITDVNTSGNERGLLGITVHPDWPDPPYVYVYFDRTPGNVNYITRFTATGDLDDGGSSSLAVTDRYDIITDIPDDASNHNGGSLRFGPDGMLYASLGEDADPCDAQDSTLFKGVILRLNVDALPSGAGGPANKALITPADNPFPAANANAGLTYCFGLRNPFRINIDPLTGAVIIADVGQNDWEELNRATGGENFGWPFREGFHVRTQLGCSEPGGPGTQDYDEPIAEYDRDEINPASIIAGPAYRLSASPAGPFLFPSGYDGVIFYAEYYAGFVRAIRDSSGTWVPFPAPGQPNPTDWATGYGFVSDWVQGTDGALYYVAQGAGEIRRIRWTGSALGVGNPVSGPSRLAVTPNPVLGSGRSLEIFVDAPGTGGAALELFDARGRLTAFRPAETLSAGPARLVWEPVGRAGRALRPGLYFLRVRGEGWTATRRVTFLP